MATNRRFQRRGLSLLRVVALGVSALGALVMPAAVATAAEPAVSGAFTPNELTMAPGETRAAVLLVQNPTATPVRIDRLEALPSGGWVQVSLDDTGRGVVAPGGSLTFTAAVTLSAVPSSDVTALTTIDYTTVPLPESKVAAQTGSVVASLTVTSGTMPSAPPSPLTIASAGDDGLVDTQFADLYFTITNTSASDLNLSRATLTFPSFLQVQLPDEGLASTRDAGTLDLPLGERLTTGNGIAVHLHVRAPRGLQPGDARLVLSIAYQDAVSKATGFTTGSHTLSLSVFGEAAVTGAFGAALAPALFVVPGLLLVLVFWFLWGRIYPRRFSVDLTPPSAITSAVALAILGVLFALPLPALYTLLWGRDYRAVYGFTDIGWMCLLGIALGLALWGLGLGIRGLIRFFRIMEGDPARKALRKLSYGRRNLVRVPTAVLKPKDPKDNAGETTVFLLRTDATTALVCPPMIAAPQEQEDAVAFETEFDRLITTQQNRALYRLIRQRGTAGGVVYREGGTVSSVPLTDLSDFGYARVVDSSRDAPKT